jgi:hypothetical protein
MAEPIPGRLPPEPGFSVARVRSLWQQGCLQEAELELEALMGAERHLCDEEAAAAFCLLGQLRNSQGRGQAAGMAFLQALRRQHDCAMALRSLYFQRFDDDDLQELLPGLDQIVVARPSSTTAQILFADWHYRVGDRDLARRIFRSLYGCGTMTGAEAEEQISERRPDALVIGAPKSGTTSLMKYLNAHPGIWCHPRKELHFFNNHFHWGTQWYADQFPKRAEIGGRLRLEATPDYLQGPDIPARVRAVLPGVKLIVVLREPVARALSWYHDQAHWSGQVGHGSEVIAAELRDLEALTATELASLGWRAPNCLAGSLYDIQLDRWRPCFSERDLLIVRFEQLCINPADTIDTIFGFLGLDAKRFPPHAEFPPYNQAAEPYGRLDPELAIRCRNTVLRRAHQLWCHF